LDAASAASLRTLLLELNEEQGTALVLVTHDPALARRMSRQYQLKDGVLVKPQ
jgi:predicted ABC-type transport system involved in lysophospholipase L1 biosynthesis ATPase subunit